MSDDASPAVPTLLGQRYQLGERIGGGRMTDVYQGSDTQTGRAVAIKILNADFVEDEAFAQRFVQEAELFVQEEQGAGGMGNPNLVQILDAGIDGATYWVAMELVSGATLAFLERQNPGPMDAARAVNITIEVCRGLAFAHGHGVIHRDVTSHNILIGSKEGGGETVKLMDAGIARPTSATSAAQTAATLGAATYISPEIARGGEPFARSDLYSLGVVLYEMLTGRPPFSGDSPVAVAMSHVRETPKRPSEIIPSIDQKLDTIVMRCLAKNPADRYASADELRVDLEQARPSSATPAASLETGGEATAPIMDSVRAVAEADTMLFTSPNAGGTGRGLSTRTLIIAAVVAGLAVAGAFLLLSRGSEIVMPNLIGQQSQVAQTALQKAGLEVVVINRVSTTNDPGIVLDQAPSAGQHVPPGQTVTLTVSVAAQEITVPNLAGLSQADALAALESAQLTLGLVDRVECPLPADQVCTQTPAAGTTVSQGTQVDFAISTGKAIAAVPTLDCTPIIQAANQLASQGLQMTIVGQETSDLCPPGNRIARQDPAPGADPPADGIVRVWTTEGVPTPSPTSPAPGAGTPTPSTFP